MIPQETKLLSMLSNHNVTFFIPPYQRNYEWTDEQCAVFLDDVIKTAELNSSGKNIEHFFGTITYFQNSAVFGQPSRLVLIDGQQRITTTMLFLVALRDILDDEQLGKYIDKQYLKNEDMSGDSEYKIKLKQVETDWVAYKNIILSEDLCDEEKTSAVYRNYRYFCNKLKDLADNGWALNVLVENGLNRFSVITIELQPDKNKWENPQEIFESMNSLGKPLSLADLVRNYLLLGKEAKEQSLLYSKYWLHIEKIIPGQVSNFIRDYMQAKEARNFLKASENNYKELYGLFKKMFYASDACELLKDLSESATLYSYVLTGTSTGNKDIDRQLKDLRTVNVTTAYSFFLVLLKEWKEGVFTSQNIVDILETFKIYCFRRRLLALTQGENKNFPTLVSRISELAKAENKKEKMFEILSRQESSLRLPNDIEMFRVMETMNFYSFRYCKFFLSLVEEKITKNRPDQSDNKLQIEHIMPRTLNDNWMKDLGDDFEDIHQKYIDTIGNLTLIRHNQELGNRPFDEKKVIYEDKTGLQIAKTMITNCQLWNADAIEARARWIINYMLNEVLPIPERMRRTNNYTPKEGRYLSFQNLQLIGMDIDFVEDPSIVAHVVSDKEVEFEGKRWHLSPLTKEIQTRRGKVNASGAYQGSWWWEYDGMRLSDFI